jgi:hypothetical protein
MPAADATKVLARDWTFSLNTGTIALPVWAEIEGINTVSFDPSKNDADTTDYGDAGLQSHLPASRGMGMSLEGFYMVDEADGARALGQAAVKAAGALIGPSGLKQWRVLDPSGEGYTYLGSVLATEGGGGVDDPAAVSYAITRSGGETPFTP